MRQKFTTLIVILLFALNSSAQKDVFLTITHKLGSNNFNFNQAATNDLGNNLNVSRIDYYMSKFVIIHDGGQLLSLPDSIIILAKGWNNVVKKLGNFNVTNVEGITFSIGVPLSYNHTDPTLYGPLNPLSPQSPSMQWGWTAGYRFVAIEGMAGPSLSTGYQMHGLGDTNYFSQTKMTNGTNANGNIYINLNADYTLALKGINVASGPIDHGVDATDLTVLQNFKNYVFSVGTVIPTGIKSVNEEIEVSIYPNPSTQKINIDLGNKNVELSDIIVIDILGREIINRTIGGNSNIDLQIARPGIYTILFLEMGTLKGTRKIIIQ
ncbi:MAG: MbnP family protein [bacterium]|nr:MbnP family protein [bacterium]